MLQMGIDIVRLSPQRTSGQIISLFHAARRQPVQADTRG